MGIQALGIAKTNSAHSVCWMLDTMNYSGKRGEEGMFVLKGEDGKLNRVKARKERKRRGERKREMEGRKKPDPGFPLSSASLVCSSFLSFASYWSFIFSLRVSLLNPPVPQGSSSSRDLVHNTTTTSTNLPSSASSCFTI